MDRRLLLCARNSRFRNHRLKAKRNDIKQKKIRNRKNTEKSCRQKDRISPTHNWRVPRWRRLDEWRGRWPAGPAPGRRWPPIRTNSPRPGRRTRTWRRTQPKTCSRPTSDPRCRRSTGPGHACPNRRSWSPGLVKNIGLEAGLQLRRGAFRGQYLPNYLVSKDLFQTYRKNKNLTPVTMHFPPKPWLRIWLENNHNFKIAKCSPCRLNEYINWTYVKTRPRLRFCDVSWKTLYAPPLQFIWRSHILKSVAF